MVESKPRKSMRNHFTEMKAIEKLFLIVLIPILVVFYLGIEIVVIETDLNHKAEIVSQELGLEPIVVSVFKTSKDNGKTHLVVTPNGNYKATFTEDDKVKLESLKE